jgi:hypothetical protein
MADEGGNIPGSGDVRADSGAESPAPPSPEPTQSATQPRSGAEPAQGGGNTTCIILGIVGGCGCIALILVLLGLFGVISWAWLGRTVEHIGPTEVPETQESDAPAEPPPGTEAPNQPPPGLEIEEPVEPERTHKPGATEAMAWARNRRPDWKAAVADHSSDWTSVKLIMAPADDPGWTTWVKIKWNTPAGRYGFVDEGPLAQEIPAPEETPEVYQPGEQVAKEAALGYAEQPDWVARVDSHNSDWTSATVSVGPPASEWVYVVSLQWNRNIEAYDLIAIDDVDYPGMQ